MRKLNTEERKLDQIHRHETTGKIREARQEEYELDMPVYTGLNVFSYVNIYLRL